MGPEARDRSAPLSRGELQCIGATTLDEYRKYIERDAALERRFQPVMVDEPTLDQTIEILIGIRERYEQHHKVTITDDAVRAAADLSIRYITDRHLPDKAIDLIDEAASRVRLRHASAPPDLRAAQRGARGGAQVPWIAGVATRADTEASSMRLPDCASKIAATTWKSYFPGRPPCLSRSGWPGAWPRPIAAGTAPT